MNAVLCDQASTPSGLNAHFRLRSVAALREALLSVSAAVTVLPGIAELDLNPIKAFAEKRSNARKRPLVPV